MGFSFLGMVVPVSDNRQSQRLFAKRATRCRLNPAAMNLRSRFGVAADWPLTYRELEPHYEQAERILGVAGRAEGSFRPRRTPYPLPAHAVSYASRRVLATGASLGLRWEPNSLAITSQPYDGRPGCNYCANCRRGCPRGDKGSADVSFLRHASESGRCTVPMFLRK